MKSLKNPWGLEPSWCASSSLNDIKKKALHKPPCGRKSFYPEKICPLFVFALFSNAPWGSCSWSDRRMQIQCPALKTARNTWQCMFWSGEGGGNDIACWAVRKVPKDWSERGICIEMQMLPNTRYYTCKRTLQTTYRLWPKVAKHIQNMAKESFVLMQKMIQSPSTNLPSHARPDFMAVVKPSLVKSALGPQEKWQAPHFCWVGRSQITHHPKKKRDHLYFHSYLW